MAMGLLMIIWFRGYKLAVTDEFLEYRDGRYRVSKIPLADCSEMKREWVEVDVKGTIMHRLEIRVIAKDRETGFTRTAFIINGEAFGKKDLQMIKDALENAKRDIERARELARGVRHGNDKEV